MTIAEAQIIAGPGGAGTEAPGQENSAANILHNHVHSRGCPGVSSRAPAARKIGSTGRGSGRRRLSAGSHENHGDTKSRGAG